jgi:hypothetical protein
MNLHETWEENYSAAELKLRRKREEEAAQIKFVS